MPALFVRIEKACIFTSDPTNEFESIGRNRVNEAYRLEYEVGNIG